MEPLAIVLGAVGLGLGFGADRIATVWPEHDEERPPGRPVDWRTLVTAVVGAVALGFVPIRFAGDTLAIALFGAWFVTLIFGLATDLDQRLLPNILTLPVIPIALLYAVSGLNPLVGDDLVPALAAAVVIPVLLYLPSIPFGAGAFGLGDVNLLAGMGMMLGGSRALSAVIVALLVAGVVLLVLLATRRVSRHSYVPFGPFFILGALWAVTC